MAIVTALTEKTQSRTAIKTVMDYVARTMQVAVRAELQRRNRLSGIYGNEKAI